MADIRIKDIATTASVTDVTSSNYIPLDGASGTKKLPADKLLTTPTSNASEADFASGSKIPMKVGNDVKWLDAGDVAKESEVQKIKDTIQDIERQNAVDLEETIYIEDSEGNKIAEINDSFSDFKNLKTDGKKVDTEKEWLDEETCGSEELIEITDDDGKTIIKVMEEGVYDDDGNSFNSADFSISVFDKGMYGEEAALTIEKVNELKEASPQNFVMSVITDSHHQPEKEQISTKKTLSTFRNICKVSKHVGVDGVVHLGDFLSSDDKYWYDNSVINREIEFIRKNLSYSSNKTYLVIGNHDGIKGSVPTTDNGYDILLTTPVVRCYGTDGKPKPYYYFKDEDKKIVGLCLAIPFKEDGKTNSWDFSSSQLDFFADALSNVANDYHVFVFCHLNEYNQLVINDENLKSFSKVLDAFNSQSSYSDSNVSVDFSAKSGTKVVAWLCGHLHADAIYKKNDWVDSDYNDNVVQNNHDFPIVMIGNACYHGTAERLITKQGHNVSVVPRRVYNEKCVDLWDTMVYQRSLNKLCFVRFGASANSYQVDADGDRIINL